MIFPLGGNGMSRDIKYIGYFELDIADTMSMGQQAHA
jgi:hypothetical protein